MSRQTRNLPIDSHSITVETTPMADKLHALLNGAHCWIVASLFVEFEPKEEEEPHLDLWLRSGGASLSLRFWSPTELKIESVGPRSGTAVSVYDVSNRRLDGIGIRVTSGASDGVSFWARTVEALIDEPN
jgi:hypothetical protein